MENKLVTHFFLKRTKIDKNGRAPIYLRLTLNGYRGELSTHKKVEPEAWDDIAQRVTGQTEQARVINVHLINLLNKANKYFLQLDSGEDKISVTQLINELKGKGISQKGLVEAYNQHIQNIEARLKIDYSRTTLKRYKSSLKGLIEFMENRYHKTEFKLSELKYEFIIDYGNYLENIKNLKHNSAAKEIKNLFKVIRFSILNGWLKSNPFKGFTCNYRDNYRECLTQEEVDLIYNQGITSKRVAWVRDVFIFQIYTGFAYSDLAKLSTDDIQTGIDGGKWIIIKRQKTGVRSSIPLLPRALKMINKYENDAYCIINKKLLPVASNQKMNYYLKELATICNIKKTLTTPCKTYFCNDNYTY